MPQIAANGLTFEYESFGRESDPALLLIMGFAAQLTGWPLALCEGLAERGFRVIRFDNRDIGKSTHLSHLGAPDIAAAMTQMLSGEKVDAPYTLDDMAMDAVSLLKALDIPSAHIVGASMGGMIAQLVAANHPGATKSLVSIMSTTGRRDLPPAKPEAMAALMAPPASPGREDRIDVGIKARIAIGSPGFREPEDVVRERVAESVDRSPYDPAGIARQTVAVIATPPRNEILKKVRAPARVLHGAEDPLFPIACAEDTAASIPGADLVIVPGMGHGFESGLVPHYLKHIGDFAASVEAKAN